MPLEFRKQRDGTLRDVWFGRYEVNGRRFCLNLDVKIGGTPPASLSLRDEGDGAFERSRAVATTKLASIVAETRTNNNAERLVEKLYEIKTGEQIKSVRLDELPEEWAKIQRKRKPNARYASQCQSTLKRFAAAIRKENIKAEEIAHVTRPAARAFMDAESNRGVTAKTWNDTLKLLRATFTHLLPAGAINPFSNMPTRETDTVFRKPFTPEELKAIVDAAQADAFIRPLMVTGMCTAMRRGDCCLLQGKDVDLKRRFITVKTAKTGQKVSIPIFPMLYDELAKRKVDAKGYVFPEQAAMYRENPDGITWRVKKVLAVALAEHKPGSPALPEVTTEEARQRGLDYIARLPDSEKKQRMKTVFEHYMNGEKTGAILAAAGVSKGSASNYLNQIEDKVGCRIVRGRSDGGSITSMLKNDSTLLCSQREDNSRRASVRDFHSFRVTWVTLALTAGVPLELVQKVTGHKTADVVFKHYFQPGQEAFRQALHSAMPKLLMNGQKSPKDEMRELIEKVKPKAMRERLLKVWAKW